MLLGMLLCLASKNSKFFKVFLSDLVHPINCHSDLFVSQMPVNKISTPQHQTTPILLSSSRLSLKISTYIPFSVMEHLLVLCKFVCMYVYHHISADAIKLTYGKKRTVKKGYNNPTFSQLFSKCTYVK